MLTKHDVDTLTTESAPTNGPVQRATLTQRVYQSVKHRILAGDLQPGDRLNEKELAAAMGVSPTPVREALNKLRGEGFVQYSAWQGATVVRLNAADIAHLYDIRCALECLAVREAARSITDDNLQHLGALLARSPGAIALGSRGTDLLHEINEQFHLFFRERSENPWLLQFTSGLNDLLILARRRLTALSDGRQAWQEHLEILEALRVGDVAGAESAMAAHINRVKTELLAQS